MANPKYNKPKLFLSKNQLSRIKNEILHSDQDIIIPLHHPLYRDIIRRYAQSIGKTAKSIVDQSLPEELDSTLYVHIYCRKANPVICIEWYKCDRHLDTHCLNCGGLLCSEYEEDKTVDNGYFKVRGKNCLLIK